MGERINIDSYVSYSAAWVVKSLRFGIQEKSQVCGGMNHMIDAE